MGKGNKPIIAGQISQYSGGGPTHTVYTVNLINTIEQIVNTDPEPNAITSPYRPRNLLLLIFSPDLSSKSMNNEDARSKAHEFYLYLQEKIGKESESKGSYDYYKEQNLRASQELGPSWVSGKNKTYYGWSIGNPYGTAPCRFAFFEDVYYRISSGNSMPSYTKQEQRRLAAILAGASLGKLTNICSKAQNNPEYNQAQQDQMRVILADSKGENPTEELSLIAEKFESLEVKAIFNATKAGTSLWEDIMVWLRCFFGKQLPDNINHANNSNNFFNQSSQSQEKTAMHKHSEDPACIEMTTKLAGGKHTS